MQFALAALEVKRINRPYVLATPWHLGRRADCCCIVTKMVGTKTGDGDLPTTILAKAIYT
jgi:hypothetical protein